MGMAHSAAMIAMVAFIVLSPLCVKVKGAASAPFSRLNAAALVTVHRVNGVRAGFVLAALKHPQVVSAGLNVAFDSEIVTDAATASGIKGLT